MSYSNNRFALFHCFGAGLEFSPPFFFLHILVGSLINERDMDRSVYALETEWANL